jgi:hypothetical protein
VFLTIVFSSLSKVRINTDGHFECASSRGAMAHTFWRFQNLIFDQITLISSLVIHLHFTKSFVMSMSKQQLAVVARKAAAASVKAVTHKGGKGKQQQPQHRGGSRRGNPPSNPRRQRVGGNLPLTTKAKENAQMPRSMMTKIVETDEYLADVSGTTGTTLSTTSYSWNPGQSTTFAWLSKEAVQWEKWEQIGDAEVYYKREVSEYATAGTTGKVLISFDTDPHDSPPATKQQVEDTDIRVDGMPSENFLLRIPANRSNGWKPKNVRIGNLPGSADIETYDGGNLYVSTYGNAATTVMGEVRIRAKFRFSVKVLESTTTSPTNYHVSLFQSTTTETAGATTVAANLLAASASFNALNIVNTSGSFVPPPGNYLVDVSAVANGGAAGFSAAFILSLDVKKNGTSVILSAQKPGQSTPVVSAGSATGSVSLSTFIACNGTDAITFPITVTYTAGAITNSGTIRFVSV